MAEEKTDQEEVKPIVLRDEHGRLLPGSKLCLGRPNPTRSQQIAIQRQFRETVGTDRFRLVVEKHLQSITEASPKDLKGLLEIFYAYYLGRPKEHIEMDVTTNEAAPTIRLDSTDLAALERMRRKLQTVDEDDDEVIDVTPTNGDE